jgi:hypothetical protein
LLAVALAVALRKCFLLQLLAVALLTATKKKRSSFAAVALCKCFVLR